MWLKDILLYLTNNEKESRHEEEFDFIFVIANITALLAGTYLLVVRDEPQWIPFLVIEFVWALDNIRHNRP